MGHWNIREQVMENQYGAGKLVKGGNQPRMEDQLRRVDVVNPSKQIVPPPPPPPPHPPRAHVVNDHRSSVGSSSSQPPTETVMIPNYADLILQALRGMRDETVETCQSITCYNERTQE